MAGEWIKMRVDLQDDPTVFRLAEILSIDELHVVGCLFCFWAWADKHAVDGHVDAATSRLIDRVSMVQGFTDAMVSVGWLSVDKSGASLPNFERHNGESAKERSLKNARQARWRAKAGQPVDVKSSTEPSTCASTREEKRREEKKKQDQEPAAVVTATPAKPKRKTKSALPATFLLTTDMAKWARDRAPSVNLNTETEKFCNHWRSKGETRADWLATWYNWMLRAQEYGSRGVAAKTTAPDFHSNDTSWANDLGPL